MYYVTTQSHLHTYVHKIQGSEQIIFVDMCYSNKYLQVMVVVNGDIFSIFLVGSSL